MFYEITKDVIGPRGDRNAFVIPPKAMVHRIKPEGTKRLYSRQHTYLT